MRAAAWIAVDWGTSNLRAWWIGPDGAVLDQRSSNAGMSGLEPDGFEPALLDLAGGWLEGADVTQAVACGMAGARQGWIEAPYAKVPCPPRPEMRFVMPATRDPRLRVHVLPGLSQDAPPDVMRGEETQLAGLLAREPAFDGVACLPGTHSKWARISAGEVVSFSSFMTGEMFDLLAEKSVLRHSVAAGGWSQEDFGQAVGDAIARPERVAGWLFGLRAGSLLEGLDPVVARSKLSGWLVGCEMAASRPWWLGQEVVLVGAAGLAGIYAEALALAGLQPRIIDATEMTLAGLAAAHGSLTS